MSREVIVKLTSDHIKVKDGEYVQDLVRCQDCRKTEERSTRFDNEKYCSVMVGWVEDNFYCGYGERENDAD